MDQAPVKFIDQVGGTARTCDPETWKPAKEWWPVTITREQFEEQIERLASAPHPANGRRQVQFVHPSANPATPGLNPGVRVTLDVLLPGEETAPIRHNSTQINFCIRGRGMTIVGG
ncbi:hypothetical protein, partial [Pseudorhodoplanes sp.]|uniref:hypothetical protein n=1 Tax=Pseudorhodoplanes sp. TaxID=1934341 RepID=UPI003D148214